MAKKQRDPDRVDPSTVICTCFCCGREFQFGPHAYLGTYVPYYKITLYKACYAGNWDGIGPYCEEKLIRHLEQGNIPVPARNNKGWLPRDPSRER